MNCAVIGGGEWAAPRSAARGVDGAREAIADLGPPAQGGATGDVDLDQQAAGERAGAPRRSGRARRARHAAPGASRAPRRGGRGPCRRAARSRPRRRPRSSRLCWRSGGRTGRGCRRSGRSRPGPRPAGSPSPRRPRASPRGCSSRISSACRSRLSSNPGQFSPRRARCRATVYAARPPYLEDDSASN